MIRDFDAFLDRSGELSKQAEQKALGLEEDGSEVGKLKAQVIRSLNDFRVFTLAARVLNDGTRSFEFEQAKIHAQQAWERYEEATEQLGTIGIRVKPVKRERFA